MSGKKILIIKTGASGDVVRTTTLLHLFNNDKIVWITKGVNCDLLPQKQKNLTILDINKISTQNLDHFDLIISLDDEFLCAQIATETSKDKLVGTYIKSGKIVYTEDSSEWFDMGLVSKFGKQKADEIKMKNKSSVQEILFRLLGAKFKGEEYLIREDIKVKRNNNLIGIEARAGDRWPTKCWHKYDELAEKLIEKKFEVRFFEQRETIKSYIEDVAECSIVVSGDTLGMHIALALKIPTVALFTCTSPTEIFGYNRMKKIVSPKLMDAFYTKEYRKDVLDAIELEKVLNTLLSMS